MNCTQKIQLLMEQRGWSQYRLSQEAHLSTSTLHSMFQKCTSPTIPTLEAICHAFGMTLVEFFSDESAFPPLSAQQKKLLDMWESLTPHQRQLLLDLLCSFSSSSKEQKEPGT